jgi:hypothetical protein
MRRVLLIATLVAFGAAGAAYAAKSVQNVYVFTPKTKVKPLKAGSKQHPVPISSVLEYKTTTKPKGSRPFVVQKIKIKFQDVQAHTNLFPACGTSTLNTKGPSGCKKGSQIGSGSFTAEIGSSKNQSQVALTCHPSVTVFNGGNNTITYYVASNNPSDPAACHAASPIAFSATLKQQGKNLVQTLVIPAAVRHPAPGFDAAAVDTIVNLPVKKRTIKHKKTKTTVGLFESIGCPPNHQRQISAVFTTEHNGTSTPVTKLVACK